MLFNYTNVKRVFANITIFHLLTTHNRKVYITSNATFKDMTKMWAAVWQYWPTIACACNVHLKCTLRNGFH